MDEPRSAVVTIYRSRARTECLERALVLEAAGIEYELRRTAGECAIEVKAPDEARARAELDASARENWDWQLQAATTPRQANGWSGVLVYSVVLVVVAVLEHRQAFAYDWLAAGRMQAGLVRQGEWWRTVTALSLHLDLLHLAANLVFGILFGLFAGQLLGSGLAWFSILIAGALGNAMNAWVQPAGHSAVGPPRRSSPPWGFCPPARGHAVDTPNTAGSVSWCRLWAAWPCWPSPAPAGSGRTSSPISRVSFRGCCSAWSMARWRTVCGSMHGRSSC